MKKILSFVAAALLAIPATFAQGFVIQGDNSMPLELTDSDIMEFSGTVIIAPFTPFTFALDMGMGQMPVGPENDVLLQLDELTSGVSGEVEIGGTGEFTLMAGDYTPLEITFAALTNSYSIKLGDSGNVAEPVYVTFNFTGIADGWEALTLPSGLTGPTYTTQIANPGSQISFQIPEDSSYEINSMEVTNRTATQIENKVSLDKVLADTWTASIYYDESFNDMEIDVNIVGKNNVTFNFAGGENAYQGVGLYDMTYDNPVALSSNSYTLNYGDTGMVSIMANEGYEISIPESANGSYKVDPIALGDETVYSVAVFPAANNATITVNVAEVPVVETSKVNFTITGVEDAWKLLTVKQLNPDEPIALTGDKFGFPYQGISGLNITAAEGYVVEITSDYKGEEEVYSVNYPSTEDGLSQFTLTLTPAANNINFTLTVTEVPVVNNSAVTFNFTGVENAYQYVNVYEVEVGVVTLASNTYKFEYEGTGILAFAAKEGYEIAISGPAYTGEDAPYAIYEQDVDGEVSYTVGCFAAANGMTFTVTVSKVEVEAPMTATFNFGGVVDAYEYVNVTEPDAENTIVLSSSTYTYEFNELGYLVISAKEGYTLSIECATEGAESGVDYSINGTAANGTIQYTVAIMEDGLTFNVMVESVDEMNAVTFNFTGVADAYKYVTVYDMSGEGYLELTAPSFTYEYAESGALTIAPVSGYMIEITCPEFTGSNAPFQIEGLMQEDFMQYVVGVWSAANGLTFDVKVSVDPTSGINSILNGEGEAVIYDLNGHKVNGKNISNGIYIINGKKVMIKK